MCLLAGREKREREQAGRQCWITTQLWEQWSSADTRLFSPKKEKEAVTSRGVKRVKLKRDSQDYVNGKHPFSDGK